MYKGVALRYAHVNQYVGIL